MWTTLRTWLLTKRQPLAVAAALTLVLLTGLVHGLWTARWSDGEDLTLAATRMRSVPLKTGDWRGESQELDEEHLERGGIAGYLRRRYVHQESGQVISVILLVGRFGPISVHTPDICYRGAGYVMRGTPARWQVKLDNNTTAEFWTARFEKPQSPAAAPLRIFWGWNAGEGWQAPSNPRWTFRQAPVLYKLYLVREMTTLNESLEKDACLAFCQTWLPTVQQTMFPRDPSQGE